MKTLISLIALLTATCSFAGSKQLHCGKVTSLLSENSDAVDFYFENPITLRSGVLELAGKIKTESNVSLVKEMVNKNRMLCVTVDNADGNLFSNQSVLSIREAF